jgi:ubiquinone/menaquinone biosynthesis C-methylase UbiE
MTEVLKEPSSQARATVPHGSPSNDPALLSDIIEWDVGNWGRAVQMWDRDLPESWSGMRALDLGAGGGGLSLYLRLRGCRVTYSDFNHPRPGARELLDRYDVARGVDYCRANVKQLPFADRQFDVVAFKSLLAVAAKFGGLEIQKRVFQESCRVLKPGGYLLLAENLYGSAFHAFCRDKFVAWGHDSRYPKLAELQEFMSPFSDVSIETFGMLAAFGRQEWQRSVLGHIDRFITPIFPAKSRYLAYGYARK